MLPIVCEQKSVEKRTITEKQLRNANKNGFGNDVGGVTNKCTGMFDVISNFDKESEEYKEMTYRIICMQGYQQEVIDSVKGCVAKKVPSHWYNYNELKPNKDDLDIVKEWKEKQLELASYKKPYFFIYNYKHLMSKYNKYIKNTNTNSIIRFGVNLQELMKKENKTNDEIEFLRYYEILMPIFKSDSTMNRICWALEEEFKDVKTSIKSNEGFNVNILKSEYTYAKNKYNEFEEIYKEYKTECKAYFNKGFTDDENKNDVRSLFVSKFKEKCYQISSNRYVVCNILLDMCYKSNESKQFVWDVCGDVIVDNLLSKNNYTIKYPIISNNSEFIWNGEGYKITNKIIKEEN